MRDELSLEDRLLEIMEAGREGVGVDRLHLWGITTEGDRLVYVTGSGCRPRLCAR